MAPTRVRDHDPDRETSKRSDRRPSRAGDFEVELPSWFRSRRVLEYLGRDPRSVTERVRGRTFTFGTRLGGAPSRVSVELGREVARCRVERPEASFEGDASGAQAQVLRLLGLVIDPRPFERRAAREADVARLVGGRRGLSIPQTASIFDGLVWVIVGQQVSLAVAFSLRRRLARRAGTHLGGELHAPPTPESVAALEERDLRGLGFSRRKAEVLLAVARGAAGGSFGLERLGELPATALEQRLLSVRGLGPWSAHYLMMRSFGLVDCVPVGDAALRRNLARFFALDARPDARETLRLMQPFAPHRSLATFHLWSLQEPAQ